MKKIFTLLATVFASTAIAAAIDTVPESAEVQTWYFNATRHYPSEKITNKEVSVAIDGEDIYFTGLHQDITSWVKGTRNSSGQYEFAPGQAMNAIVLWGAECTVGFTAYDEFGNSNSDYVTATFADNILTFNCMFGYTLTTTYSGNEVDWWDAGATLSAEPIETVEPVLNEQTAAVPYKNNFDSETKRGQVGMYSPDASGWDWGADWDTKNWYATCNNDGWTQADDHLVFPGLTLEAGKVYVMSFDAKSSSSSYWQYFDVLMAKDEAKLSKFTEYLLPAFTSCYSATWQNFEKEFTVEETGTYYLSIHSTSYAYNGYFSVDNFSVEELDTEKPEAVAMVNVTPGSKGALNATVNFSMPSKTIGGTAYESGKELSYKVTRDEYIIAEATSTAGSMVFVSDEGIGLSNGFATYKVTVADGTHVSKEATGTGFIGIDYPVETDYIEITAEGNQVTIAWAPVERGANGGYVGAKYNVYKCPGNYQRYNGEKLNEEPLTSCVYTFEYDVESGAQGEAWFCITAVNDMDESYGAYASLAVGAPYELPFTESFATDSLIWNYGGEGAGAYADRWGGFSSDGDNSSLCFYIWNWDTESSYSLATTGKICTAANATMTFDYMAQTATQLTVKLETPDGNLVTVGTYDIAAGTTDSLSIANLFDQVLDKSFVKIRFEVKMDATYQYFFIDNLKIVAEEAPEVILPAVEMEPTEINATNIKLTFTPNEATATYYCCQFDAGTLEEQFNMWSAWMGFQTPGDMVKAWGIARQGVQTVEWKNLTPNTSYDIYVLPVDAEGNYGELQCFPVTTSVQGGEGPSVIAIEIGDFGGDETNGYWQFVTYTPNDQTNVFFDLICTDEFYQENGAEGVKAYLLDEADPSNPYSSYYTQTATDVAQWGVEPGTIYHACAIGKNALGEWGEMAEVIFTTPSVTGIENVETAKANAIRFNLNGQQTVETKGLTIQNGRVIYVK